MNPPTRDEASSCGESRLDRPEEEADEKKRSAFNKKDDRAAAPVATDSSPLSPSAIPSAPHRVAAVTANISHSDSCIRPMDPDSVRRIVTGQAVMDLASCVKELLDNSIDAGAKNINIRLFQQGYHIVEVSDDGSGVPPSCRRLLAAAHATSKIRCLSEIGRTLGFRGEALHSLAALSEKLIVATRVRDEELAEKLEFRSDGTVDESTVARFPRKVGTTVAVLNLFQSIPVRRVHFREQIAPQRSKLVSLVEGYAIFHPGIRIHLMDMVGTNGQERTIVGTAFNCNTLSETISSVLGTQFLESLCRIDLAVPDLDLAVSGMISKASSSAAALPLPVGTGSKRGVRGGTIPNRKLFAVNGRPVELPKLRRLIQHVWNKGRFGASSSTSLTSRDVSWCLTLAVPVDAVDVNLTPDKRTIVFSHEEEIYQRVVSHVQELWTSQTAGHFVIGNQSQHPQQSQRPANSSLSDDDDNDTFGANKGDVDRNGDEPSLSPSRFNRRYAFSHDVSKARLQHEYDDGRKRRRSFDDPQLEQAQGAGNHTEPSASVGPSAITSSVEGSGARRQDEARAPGKTAKQMKQLEISSFVAGSAAAAAAAASRPPVTPSPNGAQTDSPRESPLSASDEPTVPGPRDGGESAPLAGENRRDGACAKGGGVTSVRDRADLGGEDDHPRVHHGGSSSASSSLSRASWVDQQRWRHVQQTFNGSSKSASSASAGLEEDIRLGFRAVDDNKAVSGGPRRFGFAQFGLDQPAIKPPGTSENVVPPERGAIARTNPAACEARENTQPEFQQRADSTRQDLALQSDSSAQVTRLETEARGTVSPSNVEPPDVSASSAALDHRSERSAVATRTSSESSDPLSLVTWDSFGTTHDVVMAAKRERLALRDRKRAFEEMRQNGNDFIVDAGTAASTATTISLRNDDFARMTVVGQFNCGFILARTADNHLWILDQHACDERANFERLCTETVIHEQRLLAPIPLELSPTEEICVMDNLEIFEKNGFRFRIDHAKPPRHRLALTALPQSGAADGRKAVVFGKDDVSALCAILQGSSDDSASSSAASLAEGAGTGVDGTGKYGNNAVRRHAGGMVVPSSAKPGKASSGSGDKILARLPKAIAMFASRACRSSIMIGKVLSDREMDRVVAKMKDLSDPWTCAHGRPTIRHVSDLHPRLESDERRVRSSILGATTTIYASQQDPASAASTSVEPGSG